MAEARQVRAVAVALCEKHRNHFVHNDTTDGVGAVTAVALRAFGECRKAGVVLIVVVVVHFRYRFGGHVAKAWVHSGGVRCERGELPCPDEVEQL